MPGYGTRFGLDRLACPDSVPCDTGSVDFSPSVFSLHPFLRIKAVFCPPGRESVLTSFDAEVPICDKYPREALPGWGALRTNGCQENWRGSSWSVIVDV